ncbi:MAG: RNA-directed DNA polymerase [Candidatus Syntrophoarchaeum sp.]|nr:RNA-directed DNA polymerase [Candidatus Syntrophoarchaeum sp.]
MKLSTESIEFAKNHIKEFYDSDFFVKPFEFEVLQACWDDVQGYLLDTEISAFSAKVPIAFAAHKPKGGFRVVHQLDPIDSLVYTALAYEVAESVENRRIPIEDRIACSYRIKTDDDGNFFVKDNGYNDFFDHSEELANSYSYVLVTDITDFYNQIYLHRLNSIEQCCPNNPEISKDLEKFLMKLNNKTSMGIPVGPAASIIMAEASLIDIDEFIFNRNANYVRYVDDFRIFSNSKIELELLLQDLTMYLYSSHRLNLSSSATF